MVENNQIKVGIAAALAGATAAFATMALMGMFNSNSKASATTDKPAAPLRQDEVVAVIGDVGGTNVRLTLRKLCLRTRTSTEIKPLTKIASQGVKDFATALAQFLAEFERDSPNWPKIGAVGIAGEVKNNVVFTTNIPGWCRTDGKAIEQEFGMESFELVNDFVAAGHGLLQLKEKDYERMNRSPVEEGGVKLVLGPGTGHGQGFLVKSKFAPCYDVFPTEGGHCEFTPRSELDLRLMQFAKEYVETSDHVENFTKKKITRISHERLGAGPAIPLIYEFMKKEFPNLPLMLETGASAKNPNEISSHDVINAALQKKDALCAKVVDKFTEIFAVETGDTALKFLPYGGIYLIGGVTMGIRDQLIHDPRFMENFYAKGRCDGIMRRFPVMVLNPQTELGILGAEEVAYRLLGSYSATSE